MTTALRSLCCAFPRKKGLFNQPLPTKSRATSVRKSPPERERFHFKATLRHPSSSASCFYSFISLSFSSAGIKPPLVVVSQTAAAFFLRLLSSGIRGLDCRVFCGPPPPRSSWGGSICCKAEWDIQSNPSGEFRVSPLACWNPSRRRTPHQRPGPAQSYSQLHLDVSACP